MCHRIPIRAQARWYPLDSQSPIYPVSTSGIPLEVLEKHQCYQGQSGSAPVHLPFLRELRIAGLSGRKPNSVCTETLKVWFKPDICRPPPPHRYPVYLQFPTLHRSSQCIRISSHHIRNSIPVDLYSKCL